MFRESRATVRYAVEEADWWFFTILYLIKSKAMKLEGEVEVLNYDRRGESMLQSHCGEYMG